MQRAIENTGDDRYCWRLLRVCASLRWFSPAYLQPGEESLYVGHAGVWQGLLKHAQQQAVGQGKGQKNAVARAPRLGHPGELTL